MASSGAVFTAATVEENFTMNLIDYLTQERKLDPALLDMMRVKEVSHPTLGPALAFPYLEAGKPLAAKFRTEDKRWASTKGVTRPLYNLDALSENEDQPIIITEGEVDTLSCIQAGYPRTVSVPDGWTEQGNKTESLIAAEDKLRKSPYVIVAGDSDKAGESLPVAVANILKGHDVRYVTWPDGQKDANDVLKNFGEAVLSDAIGNAKRIDPAGSLITSISDIPPVSARRVLRTGIQWLDQRLAFEIGTMSIGTGVPGSGKSTLTTFAAYHIAKSENARVGIMAFESHAHTIREHITRLHTGRKTSDLTEEQQRRAFLELDPHFRLVHQVEEDDVQNHLGWLEETIRTLAIRERCNMIIVDPWNEIEHLPEVGESMTNYINFALKKIRQWAKELEIHICVIAHPKKMPSVNGQVVAPVGYDVSDSAAFFNKPALGFTVHQSKTQTGVPYVQVITWKVREVQLYGITKGVSTCSFDPETMHYSHIELEDDQ